MSLSTELFCVLSLPLLHVTDSGCVPIKADCIVILGSVSCSGVPFALWGPFHILGSISHSGVISHSGELFVYPFPDCLSHSCVMTFPS